MKVIQVAGYSESGKTTFIRSLIPLLGGSGTVATLKHLGHHSFALENRKDTTQFFSAGAEISVGVDGEKSVFIIRSHTLEIVLERLCDAGVMYAIIEGFKAFDFPKVIIGDLESERCILRNPSPIDVLNRIQSFPDIFTLEGVVKEFCRMHPSQQGSSIVSFQGRIDHRKSADDDKRIMQKMQDAISSPGGVKTLVRMKRNLFSGPDIIFIVVCARNSGEGMEAMIRGIEAFRLCETRP